MMQIVSVIGLLIVLNFLDVYTTYKIISSGGRELNAYVKWFINRLGLLKGLIASKIIIIPFIVFLWFYPSDEVMLMSLLLPCFYLWVVIHNFRELKKIP